MHVCYTAYTIAHMIRKQIYLTQELDQHILVISQKENKPEAKVICELLETGIRKQHPMSTGEGTIGTCQTGREAGY